MKNDNSSTISQWFFAFSSINASLAIAICCMNIPASAFNFSLINFLFTSSALVGHFIFMFIMVGLPGFGLIMYVQRRLSHTRSKTALNSLGVIWVFLANLILLILIYLDTRIFEMYRFHLNGMIFELITGGALQDNLSFNFLVWFLFAAIGVGILSVEIFFARLVFTRIKANPIKQEYHTLFFGFIVGAMLISQTIYLFADARNERNITSIIRYIPWAHGITARRNLEKLGVEIKASKNENLTNSASDLNYPKNELICKPEVSPNILFVVVDSLRADALDPNIMPNMWKLSQQSHHFTEHYAAGNSTRFGIFGLMYGLTGNYWHTILEEEKGSELVNQLDKQQYKHYVYTSAPIYSPEFDETVFLGIKDQLNEELGSLEAYENDQYMNRQFLQRLEQHDDKDAFFGFLFYDAPHSYSYPEDFEEKFLPSWEEINYLALDNDFDRTEFFNLYKNTALYTDSVIQEVIDKLEDKDLLDNTIIIFTSDHGQEFNDRKQNYWGHNGNFSQFQTKIPLFIRWPESHAKYGYRLFDKQTASIDIVPTLLSEVLSCENPISDYSVGENFYAEYSNNKPLLIESWSRRAIRGQDTITVFYTAGGSDVFDLNYDPLKDHEVSPEDYQTIIKQMREFYR